MKLDEIKLYDGKRQEWFLNDAEIIQKEIDEYKKMSKVHYNYSLICERTATLIKSIAGDMQDDGVYMTIFTYLYRNGYFSCNKYFEFGYDSEEINCNMGLSVITGKGVCRNIASFFKDVLIAIKGRPNGIMVVGTNNDEVRDGITPISDLPKEFDIHVDRSDDGENNNRPNREFIPNHAEVLVFDKNDSYSLLLYDPTNIRITKIDYSNYSSDIADRKAVDFRVGIWDINTNLTTMEARIEYVKRFGRLAERIEGSKFNYVKREDMELIMEYVRRQCDSHKSEIEEFYNENKMWYSIIKDQAASYIERLSEQAPRGK